MPALLSFESITKLDVYVFLIISFFVFVTLIAIKRSVVPSLQSLMSFIALLNSKGGLIFVLLILWIVSFAASITLGLWALIKGVSPQNAILMMLLSWVTGQAWGNINGALLKTMTGEQPPITTSTSPKPEEPKA